MEWSGTASVLAEHVREQSRRCLAAYREDPHRVEEDAAIEVAAAEGGYGRKQIHELIQNAADALLDSGGSIEVLLTDHHLYVANEGRPFTVEGVDAVMASHLSRKRGEEIGRFGLGFKSVTAVTDQPQIFSRSVSLGFDRQRSTSEIRSVVGDAPKYSVLRLAHPLDPGQWSREDPELAELMRWATTIVRLPLKVGTHLDLREDFDAFPSRFVIFSPHVRELVLRDPVRRIERVVNVAARGDRLRLDDGGSESEWHVLSATHRPSREALDDAGELAKRDEIRVDWAVPITERAQLGELWAYFPTGSRTTLSGLVNAPWKLSEDRLNLIEGTFNLELLEKVVPGLLARSLTRLQDVDDPASLLDILPARGKESRSWADDKLNRPVFEQLSRVPALPDGDGTLRVPRELRLNPRDLPAAWLEVWSSACPHPHEWVHHAVNRTAERRLKAERLRGDRPTSDLKEWLEAIVAEPTVEASTVAVELAATIATSGHEHAASARAARVLLLEDGSLVAPVPGKVFVRNSAMDRGYAFIDSRMAERPDVIAALKQLGIQVLDPAGSLRNALLRVVGRPDGDWGHVWTLARSVDLDLAAEIFREVAPHPHEKAVRVRVAGGGWKTIATAFLGGGIIPSSGSRDRAFLIDPQYHQSDLDLLVRLGAVAQPVLRNNSPGEAWLDAYRDVSAELFIAAAAGSKPARDKVLVDGPRPPWPLELLPHLSDEGRVLLTEAALMLDAGDRWTVKHATNAGYGRKSSPGPVTWWVRRHGRLRTALGSWPVSGCLKAMDADDDVFPVPDVSGLMADRLGFLPDPRALSHDDWDGLMLQAGRWPDDRRRSRLYTWAVHFSRRPNEIVALAGAKSVRCAPRQVAVALDEDVYRALQEQHIPCILAVDPDDEAALRSRWGLDEGRRLLQREIVVEASGEPTRLVDVYPALRLQLPTEFVGVDLQYCSAITLITPTPGGQTTKQVPGLLHEGRVAVTATEDVDVLRQVSNALSLEWTAADVQSVLTQLEAAETRRLRSDIRRAVDDDRRLAVAVGADLLRRAIPQSVLQLLEQERGRAATADELAVMAKAVHGTAVLQYFKARLEEQKLEPPVMWAGQSTARRFVSELGFPLEYAGSPGDSRPAVFEVEGPARLGPLHDYQQCVADRIKALLRGEGPARGMVSLPTGAGKTRVAVQALVEEAAAGRLRGPVLWIAQGDELCEQAVQTWAHVWRAIGPETRLTVNRFWSKNDVVEDPGAFQVVVATDDKLVKAAIDDSEYDWLADAEVLVVDEAHTSVTRTYTRIFEWTGRGRSRVVRQPLLGLTATPFRNTNDEETKRLINRYDANRLDVDAFGGRDPYQELQRRGVLARVRQRELHGAKLALSPSELTSMEARPWLPPGLESRLGEDRDRNRRIVDSVAGLPDDWPVLLFATSVEHARGLAALLSIRGVPAVAVSSETDAAVRRRSIAGFQNGEIRVITNYNVLAQGFDAPAVRAVYVTRPTFSTNLYQQMIGRGLRGPKNGGSEEVLIVNVRDNLDKFGDRLAFYDFEYLWSGK